MDRTLLEQLSIITDEEQSILDGNKTVDRHLYYRGGSLSRQNEIDASVLLEKGRLIDIRPNTRFIHFPLHTHNFVELVYMCQGSTTHIIDGSTLTLSEGDLLFMNQHARQEILPAGKDDIAVNFIILPQFFENVLTSIDSTSSNLRDFLVSCLTDQNMGGSYLYFAAAGILPVQNLMENLIWILLKKDKNYRLLSQETMALLFMHLMNETASIHMPEKSWEQDIVLKLLDYIDEQYKNASLSDFAAINNMDIYTLGRLIHKYTGRTFTQLLAEKRMNLAAWLLTNTKKPVGEISLAIGYENTSYFHRLFMKTWGCSPAAYRRKHD